MRLRKEQNSSEIMSQLTVHRNVNGNTNDPASGSLSTKLDPPIIALLTLPNEHPWSTPGCVICVVLCWYSFRHSRKAVAHGGQPVVLVLRILNGTPQQYPDIKWLFVFDISKICNSKFPDDKTCNEKRKEKKRRNRISSTRNSGIYCSSKERREKLVKESTTTTWIDSKKTTCLEHNAIRARAHTIEIGHEATHDSQDETRRIWWGLYSFPVNTIELNRRRLDETTKNKKNFVHKKCVYNL